MKKHSYLKYIFHALIIVGVIIAGVKYLKAEELSKALYTFNYWYAPFILALSSGYFLLKGWRFVILMQPISDLPRSVIMKGYLAGQVLALIPGGIAARAGLMEQAGEDVGKSSAPVIFNSLLDQLFLLVGALVAALWFEEARFTILMVLGVMVVVGLALAIPVTRKRVIEACSWVADKCNLQGQWQKFLKAVPEVASLRTLAMAMVLTVAAFTLQVIALDLALRGVDSPLPVNKVFMVFVLPTILGRILPTPGGFGVTEAGMVGFIVSNSEINTTTAAAAVVIFRIGTIVFEVLVGAIIYFLVWRGDKEADRVKTETGEVGESLLTPEPEKIPAINPNL